MQRLKYTHLLFEKITLCCEPLSIACLFGVTGSAFSRRLGGDGFNSQPKPRHSYIRKILYLLLLCQVRDINCMSRGNALAQNRNNSIPCTVRTSIQRSCNQRVGCMQQLGSRAFGPAKLSGPRLLSTVPWGMTLMSYFQSMAVAVAALWFKDQTLCCK